MSKNLARQATIENGCSVQAINSAEQWHLVNKCLILGWLTLIISSILGCIFGIIAFLVLCIFNCNGPKEYKKYWTRADMVKCNIGYGVIIGVIILLIALFAGFAVIGWKCIKGTKARNHYGVKPMMILLGVLTVLSLTQIGMLSTGTIIGGIVDALISAYCFVVMYSLYTLFRQEYERGGNRFQPQYQLAATV